MSNTEITRQLRLYQSDSWYRGARRVPFAALAREIGVSRDTLHAAARETMSEATAERLVKVFTSIEAGRIRFLRRDRVWETERREPPDPLPAPQPRLIVAEGWNEWARCRSCGGNRWQAVEIPGSGAHKVCLNCLPPPQWPAFGGRKILVKEKR